MSLIPPHFKLQEVTVNDIIIASIAWGFTLGFGQLTTWTAARQTWVAYKRTGMRVFRNVYIGMIWGEIIVCLAFSIICFLHLRGIIHPCFGFYFGILTLWALQVHFLLQIIINRCRIIAQDKLLPGRLKIGVAVLITAVNITVYNIWIPARLEISETYIHTNAWWDRVEKVIYMITDACLNIYFIRVVQHELVRNGLTKYRSLVHFNMFIIGFSLSMDLLIITIITWNCAMKTDDLSRYMQFHPLAYIVKLNIELSMADLIGRIARSRNDSEFFDSNPTSNDSRILSRQRSRGISISVPTIERWHNIGFGGWNRGSDATTAVGFNDITRPDAIYTVNATTNTDIESGLSHSKDIYTTREFRVDFEKMAPEPRRRVSGPNIASTSRRENEDTGDLPSDQKDYIVTDDTPR
ncbi:hypothetical protein F4859DRAFT_501730 [Xylaria cf. heliscus]|nr:hypothetical protein F4859DRAFT_501730 [Xylaria cf. heliscus]